MTVKELISKLQEHPQHAQVCIVAALCPRYRHCNTEFEYIGHFEYLTEYLLDASGGADQDALLIEVRG